MDFDAATTGGGGPDWGVRALRVCAATVVALGLSAIAGWAVGRSSLAALNAESVPMAPSTALLFVVHGGLLAWRSRARAQGGPVTALVGADIVLGLGALGMLGLTLTGQYSRAEHLGLPVSGEQFGVPLGHMSPVTAAGFLLVAVANLLDAGHPRLSRHPPTPAALAAGLLLALWTVLLLAYVYGRPFLYSSGTIPPAASTAVAFVLLAAGLLLRQRQRCPPPRRAASTATVRDPRAEIGLFLACAALALGGALHYRAYATEHRAEMERHLAAIAALKVSELTQWRRERRMDAELMRNDNFVTLVSHCLSPAGEAAACGRVATWLHHIRQASGYERVLLLDATGRERLSSPRAPEAASPQLSAALAEVLRAGETTLLDLHRDHANGPAHLSVLVPLHDPARPAHALGLLVLRIDPNTALFPILTRWPLHSESAETLLVRRERDEVVYLSPLRFDAAAPLDHRARLSLPDLPAAMAASGTQGAVTGRDYRGSPVLAALREVPDSPWSLVALIDQAEALAPLRAQLLLTSALVTSLMAGLITLFALLRRAHGLRLLEERTAQHEALRASEAELRRRNEELQGFTYAVSHDLKSPLVTIETFLGYLEQDLPPPIDEETAKDIQFMRGAARKMSRLLDELAALSRVGRVKTDPVDVSLRELLDEAQALVAGRLAERQVTVRVSDAPLILRGDRTRLVEVFQNLLDNAAQFLGDQPAPQIDVEVDTTEKDPVIRVRDNGSGFDPRYADKVFGLFEKLDPSSDGTGVGLTLVRRVVDAHGGRVWAESAGVGRGATFTLQLPGARLETGRAEP